MSLGIRPQQQRAHAFFKPETFSNNPIKDCNINNNNTQMTSHQKKRHSDDDDSSTDNDKDDKNGDQSMSPKRRRMDLAPSFASLSLNNNNNNNNDTSDTTDSSTINSRRKRSFEMVDNDDVSMDSDSCNSDSDHQRHHHSHTRQRRRTRSNDFPENEIIYVDSLEDYKEPQKNQDEVIEGDPHIQVLDSTLRQKIDQIGKLDNHGKDTLPPLILKQLRPPPKPERQLALVLYRPLKFPPEITRQNQDQQNQQASHEHSDNPDSMALD